MSDTPPTTATPGGSSEQHEEDEHHPRGTMAVTLIFLLGTAIVWLWTFSMLIGRSAS